MPYLGYEPSKVAVTVGQGVIDATHIQDASITTADLGNDSVTPIKVDDDGTGFQMGSLGLGTAVSGSEKLTVGGTASFSGNITGTLATAAQSNITSVGTLTTLQVGGQNSTPKLEWFYDHSNGTDYKANISLAGNDLEVRGSSGTMEFYTGAVDGASSTLALSIDSSQNATFVGDVSLSTAGKKYYIPRESDGALTGSLYSSTGNTITLSGAGSSSGIINFIPSASNSSAVVMTMKANGEIQFGDSNNTASLYHYGEGKFAINDSAGSASTPTYAFNSDTDTGMYRGGANDLRFATDGTQRMQIESDGTVVIAGALQPAGNVTIGGALSVNGTGTSHFDGLLQAKRGFTNGQALDIEGETFGRTNSSNVAFGYRQDGDGQLMKIQKSTSDVFIMTNSGRIAQNISEASAYCATFENTSSGGHGLRVYGGASSADYLIRGHDHNGNDRFAVRSNGEIQGVYGASHRLTGNWKVLDVVSEDSNDVSTMSSNNPFNDQTYSHFKIVIPWIGVETDGADILCSFLYDTGSGLTEATSQYYGHKQTAAHGSSSYQGGAYSNADRMTIFNNTWNDDSGGINGEVLVYNVTTADMRNFSGTTYTAHDHTGDGDRGSNFRPFATFNIIGYDTTNGYGAQHGSFRQNDDRHASYWKGIRFSTSTGNFATGSKFIVMGMQL